MSSYNAVKLNFAAELDTVEKRQSTYFEYSHAENGKVISSSTVLFVKPKHFMFIDPQIQVNISEEDDQFVIRLSTRSFAKYVELELSEADCVFSDNYFDLSAGCEKSIEVRKNRLSLPLTLGEMKRQFRIRSLIDSAS